MVCLGSQHFKELMRDTALVPAHVASINCSKVAKAFGQVTLGNTDTITVEHTLDKGAIILGSHSDGSNSA